MQHRIIVFLNARAVCPSGYYRITQFFDASELTLHALMSSWRFQFWHRRSRLQKRLIMPLHFLLILMRTLGALVWENLRVKADDVIIVNRTISPHYLPAVHAWLLRRLGRRAHLIWDFDDHLLEQHIISVREHQLLSEITERIVVTHDFLKDRIAEEHHNKVLLLPTTDGDMLSCSTDELLAGRLNTYVTEVRLVWLGTSGNLAFLDSIVPELDHCAALLKERTDKRLVLEVVCNHPLDAQAQTLQIVNVDWSHERAIDALRHSHIGLMPLREDNFTKGKGGFKLIQCLGAALPVVASSVGFNVHVVTDACGALVDDGADTSGWTVAVMALATDADVYRQACLAAREQYFAHFDYKKARKEWRKLARLDATDVCVAKSSSCAIK